VTVRIRNDERAAIEDLLARIDARVNEISASIKPDTEMGANYFRRLGQIQGLIEAEGLLKEALRSE
jgi:hypothetical protein